MHSLVLTAIRLPLLQTVADLGTISAVNIAGPDGAYRPMTNTYGAAWEVPNQPAYPISLEVTSGSQTVSHASQPCLETSVLSCVIGHGVTSARSPHLP